MFNAFHIIVEALAASWIEIVLVTSITPEAFVEALAASWIEISIIDSLSLLKSVEALAASWIEIFGGCRFHPL